jgi:hypothetical protein
VILLWCNLVVYPLHCKWYYRCCCCRSSFVVIVVLTSKVKKRRAPKQFGCLGATGQKWGRSTPSMTSCRLSTWKWPKFRCSPNSLLFLVKRGMWIDSCW